MPFLNPFGQSAANNPQRATLRQDYTPSPQALQSRQQHQSLMKDYWQQFNAANDQLINMQGQQHQAMQQQQAAPAAPMQSLPPPVTPTAPAGAPTTYALGEEGGGGGGGAGPQPTQPAAQPTQHPFGGIQQPNPWQPPKPQASPWMPPPAGIPAHSWGGKRAMRKTQPPDMSAY